MTSLLIWVSVGLILGLIVNIVINVTEEKHWSHINVGNTIVLLIVSSLLGPAMIAGVLVAVFSLLLEKETCREFFEKEFNLFGDKEDGS